MGLPDFVIIGAQKSGTTSLRDHLSSHPHIFMPEREVHFFDRQFDRGADWYAAQFDRGGDAVVGEKTAELLFDPAAPRRMHELIPNARLVAILRNPVDRAYSEYWQELQLHGETRSFADAVAQELDGWLPRADDPRPLAKRYLARGRYVEQLELFAQLYPAERMHLMLLEEMRRNPVVALQAVMRFVGVADTFVPPAAHAVSNRSSTIRSRQVLAIGRRLPRSLRRPIVKLNTKAVTKPPLEESLQSLLADYFRDWNDELESRFGLDVSEWT